MADLTSLCINNTCCDIPQADASGCCEPLVVTGSTSDNGYTIVADKTVGEIKEALDGHIPVVWQYTYTANEGEENENTIIESGIIAGMTIFEYTDYCEAQIYMGSQRYNYYAGALTINALLEQYPRNPAYYTPIQ